MAWRLLWLILALVVTLAVVLYAKHTARYWDDKRDVAALPMPEPDALGESYRKVEYLEQGWKPEQSIWFYNVSQGSNLIPYDFFLALRQEKSDQRFRDNANINAYRYLPQAPTPHNPDGLPLGFVRDRYQGRDYVGLTCAACHTGQVVHNNIAYRIDGGGAGADMERFMVDLSRTMRATLASGPGSARYQTFVQEVLDRKNYKSEKEVIDDLAAFTQRLEAYAFFNEPTHAYRFGRLDAFGRIYNRVLEHVLTGDNLRTILLEEFGAAELGRIEARLASQNIRLDGKLTARQRSYLVTQVGVQPSLTGEPLLSREQQLQLRKRIFNSPNAPVSYPFLWDAPQHDYVQWNGLASNAGLGPLGRNAGEVIGVFGTLEWQPTERSWFDDLITGQHDTPYDVNYKSSLDVHNLIRIESQMRSLKSPEWPKAFGTLDQVRITRGRLLFNSHCLACHGRIDRADPRRRIAAQIIGLDVVKTDPLMARNSVNHSGYSGILRSLYVGTNVGGDMLIPHQAPVANLLAKADMNSILTPHPDKWFFNHWLERLYDFVLGYSGNDIKPSIKQGHYTPDTTAQPFNSLLAYKARPLNGIWATAPYLHNGSVPTLYDLLLPASKDQAGADGESRPVTFKVGQREFDPQRVGLKTDKGDVFDTRLPGNTNVGHEYGAVPSTLPDGTRLRAFNREERLDLLEYLKSL
jgi:hypothetical protein